MRTLEQHITQYAAYHRDRRNIATHFIGIPLIVFSVALALAVVNAPIGNPRLSMALLVTLVAVGYYLYLDLALGAAMLVYMSVNYGLACELSAILTSTTTLWVALAIFVGGWILQFLGHKYEGVKPAFVDDMMGLVIGPLFMMTEVFFALGQKPGLRRYVEDRVGPTLAARNGAPIGPVDAKDKVVAGFEDEADPASHL
ncbi:MAG: DUF962 domain-containing protein [Betaproteobacteria bacterium]|nr:DUF962 domain-containing protein [Betaproteobacteria bacterium]